MAGSAIAALLLLATPPATGEVDAAPIVVRAKVGESWTSRPDPSAANEITYGALDVEEVLRGRILDARIKVRQPGAGEDHVELPPAGTELIVLLDEPDPSDGSYPLFDFPAGRFRVVHVTAGEAVMISDAGIDPAFLSPKDLRPRSEASPMPLPAFRALVRDRGEPLAVATRQRAPALAATERPIATATAAISTPPTADAHGERDPGTIALAVLSLLAVIAALLARVLFRQKDGAT